MPLRETAASKNAPKHGDRCKSCNLKDTVKFQQKYCQNRRASFALFTLCCAPLHIAQIVGEIDFLTQFEAQFK